MPMQQEKIIEFNRRLSQCNKGEMIVIIYQIAFAYIEDAKKASQMGDDQAFHIAVCKTQKCVRELIQALDFSYDLAKELYPLYVFVNEHLSKAMIRNRMTEVEEAEEILKGLYESFEKVAKEDHSKPLMKNAQQVYAGVTYGKHDVTEMCQDVQNNRGFLV